MSAMEFEGSSLCHESRDAHPATGPLAKAAKATLTRIISLQHEDRAGFKVKFVSAGSDSLQKVTLALLNAFFVYHFRDS